MLVLSLALFVILGRVSGLPLEDPAALQDGRIHGGVDAPPAFAPHMVALLTQNDGRLFIVCGGSIITRRHVLTAAHCITPFVDEEGKLAPTFLGRVGSNIWHSGGLLIHFAAHFIHPEWDLDTIKNDVGILALTKCLKLTEKIAVIGLDFGWVGGGEETFVTGWGTTWPNITDTSVHLAPTPDMLQLLHTLTMSPHQCVALMQSSPEWITMAPPLNAYLELCTFHSFGYGVCHGDSGSAVVSEYSRKQVAIVSWGIPCARGAPDIHTRVSGMKYFIIRVLDSENTCDNL